MRSIKFGDKKPARTLDTRKSLKEMILDAWDNMGIEEAEKKLIELKEKQRSVNEAAKKRF